MMESPSTADEGLAVTAAPSFARIMEAKGWTSADLVRRWGLSRRRIQQLMACTSMSGDCPAYYEDAFHGLPMRSVERPVRQARQLSEEAFRRHMERRGWNVAALAARWGMTTRRVQQIIAYPSGQRPAHYDDGVRGLPRHTD